MVAGAYAAGGFSTTGGRLKAIIFGAGRIGCGFVGQLLHQSGYEVCMIARPPMLNCLAAAGGYVVRLVSSRTQSEYAVDQIRVIDVSRRREVAAAIADADLVCIAVGSAALHAAAPLLAEGLAAARGPVNVIAFSNVEDAGPRLRRMVMHCGGRFSDRHGFSGAVVSRAVVHRRLPLNCGDPVLLVGDPLSTFVVDAGALRDPFPAIRELVAVVDFTAHYRSKLYRYSAGHAAAAYLGYLRGHIRVHDAVRDPQVRLSVRAAMAEGRAGLLATYGPEIAGSRDDLDVLLARFDNASLDDEVARVGRDVVRKLGRSDRLIAPALMAEHAGTPAVCLAETVAAALFFPDAGRPPLTCHRDLARLLLRTCRLSPHSPLGRRIHAAWKRVGTSQHECRSASPPPRDSTVPGRGTGCRPA